MGGKAQITVAANAGSLTAIRAFVDETCQKAGIDDAACYDVKLAVDEACSNIMEHGGEGEASGSIVLSLHFDESQIAVHVTDFGRPFEPSEPPAPDAEAALASGTVGGFGLYFIYRFMDDVSYASNEAGNTLTMVKRFGK
jgi:anti-sigma regulatory factor (Ser/Thr protein kinase)